MCSIHYQRLITGRKVVKQCAWCKTDITSARSYKYCSKECYEIVHNLKWKGYNVEKSRIISTLCKERDKYLRSLTVDQLLREVGWTVEHKRGD